jgi:hypothetical protein
MFVEGMKQWNVDVPLDLGSDESLALSLGPNESIIGWTLVHWPGLRWIWTEYGLQKTLCSSAI